MSASGGAELDTIKGSASHFPTAVHCLFQLAARAEMTQSALSRLEAGGVVPTIPLLERISAALDADLIVEIAPHAA